jgi:hypothetical protein
VLETAAEGQQTDGHNTRSAEAVDCAGGRQFPSHLEKEMAEFASLHNCSETWLQQLRSNHNKQ